MDGFILYLSLMGIGILIYLVVRNERGMMASEAEAVATQAASKLGVEIAEIKKRSRSQAGARSPDSA
ncbi:hypothetical protein [Bradyrhizobium sp. 33ap4]|uniref:hypothetical protein n=1 Tax=Bradyrhizobium sp. 33ap4 TaxID=3061630 RepID=UPI002930A46F|nr:hypothetical protein [Bradyrhizobium sp. 33ap4]